MLPDHNLNASSFSLSDHCPLMLCHQIRPRVKDNFRFENFWTRIRGFRQVVQQAWNRDVPGLSALNILHYRLQNMAMTLKNWSKTLFENARLELQMASEVIHRLDVAQESRPLSTEEAALRSELKIRVLGLAAIERSRCRQASRLVWLKEGDTCTRFFHL
jgi:hypothetical protein